MFEWHNDIDGLIVYLHNHKFVSWVVNCDGLQEYRDAIKLEGHVDNFDHDDELKLN